MLQAGRQGPAELPKIGAGQRGAGWGLTCASSVALARRSLLDASYRSPGAPVDRNCLLRCVPAAPALLQSMGTACRWTWGPRAAAILAGMWPPMQVRGGKGGQKRTYPWEHAGSLACTWMQGSSGSTTVPGCTAPCLGKTKRLLLGSKPFQWEPLAPVAHLGATILPPGPVCTAGGLRLLRYGSLHGSVLGLEAVLAGKQGSAGAARHACMAAGLLLDGGRPGLQVACPFVTLVCIRAESHWFCRLQMAGFWTC